MKIEVSRRENRIAKHPKVVIAAAVVLIVMGLLTTGLLLNERGEKQTGVSADVDSGAVDWDGNLEQNTKGKGNPDADSIAIPGYPEIHIPAGQTDVDVILGNPEGNPCYFVYTLVLLDEAGKETETLYTSKQIPPGKAVQNISLSHALEKGEYHALLKISTAHLETQAVMNGANVKTKLIVE